MRKRDMMTQEEIDALIEKITTGLSLPLVLQSLITLTGNWRIDARTLKQPTSEKKWQAVQDALTEAYHASVRRYDGLG